MNALRLAIKNVLGQDLHVELCVLPAKQKLESDIEIKPSRERASTAQPTQKEVSDILEDPGVVSSLEIFGGRVIDVRK
jgi:hypothetical protein